MRRVYAVLVALVLLEGAVLAQNTIQPGQKVALGVSNAVAIIQVVNDTVATTQIQGTWSGTLSFEGSLDGSTFTSTACTAINSTTPVTSTVSNGVFSCNTIGLNFIQVRFSAYTSGAAIVSYQTAYVAQRQGTGGGGGGGSGTVTTFSSGTLSPLFTTSVADPSTTPALTFALSNVTGPVVYGKSTAGSGVPSFFQPVLSSALFSNQGTTTQLLRGNAAGNPTWENLSAIGMISVMEYGATGNGVTDDTAAIQSAITTGYSVYFPKGSYKITSPLTVTTAGQTLLGSGPSSTTITQATAGAHGILIQASYVTVEALTISISSHINVSIGIQSGTNNTTNDGNMGAGSATLTSATANFTAGDVGKSIFVTGQGIFNTIAGFTNSTTVTLTTPNGGGVITNSQINYGTPANFVTLRSVVVSNGFIGVNMIAGQQYRIEGCTLQGTWGAKLENRSQPDAGDSYVSDSGIAGNIITPGSGGGIWLTSGGALKIVNNKLAFGQYAIYFNFTIGGTEGAFVANNSIEGSQQGFYFSSSSTISPNMVTITGNEFYVGGQAVAFDPAGGKWQYVVMTGNIMLACADAGATCLGTAKADIDLGNVDRVTISSNNLQNSSALVAGTIGINVRVQASNVLILPNHFYTVGTNVVDAGGTAITDASAIPFAITVGGTGQTTKTAAFDALSPVTTQGDVIYRNATNNVRLAAGTAGQYLRTGGAGANPTWANPNLASEVTGTLAIGNGGTGQTTQTNAFDALAPTTTQGDVIYYNGTDNVRLAAGTSGQFLKTQGGAANPTWAAVPYGQFAVLEGDSLGMNPANTTRYFFAQNVNIDANTPNSAFQHVLASTCTLRGFSVVVTVAGALDTAANNVAFSVRVNNATDYGTTNVTFQAAQQTVTASGLSQALNAGDQLQITFLTPTFTTPPTLVFMAGGILCDKP